MTETFRLGHIAGIRVGVNASVVVIVLIITFGLAFGYFPAAHPGRSIGLYLLAGLLTAAVFLGSLLAHEIAHALVARRHGVEVEGITLWLLGGVAQLKGEPRTPAADLRIAVVGPLTSFVLGVVFAAATALLVAAGAGGLTVAVLAYLAWINIILAVFNLIPAAPLDGGRVLRAFLWRRKGDRVAAAVTAARAGRWFGFALIVLGVLRVVGGFGLGGLWLVLLGLFLVHAATAEEQQAQLSGALARVLVRDVMTSSPVVVYGDLTVDQFLRDVVLGTRYTTYPLVDPTGRLQGLVTLNRLRDVPPDRRAVTRLQDIAVPPDGVPLAEPGEALVELLPRMSTAADGRAVVVDSAGRVVGIVSPRDISRAMQLSNLGVLHPYSAPGRGADVLPGPP